MKKIILLSLFILSLTNCAIGPTNGLLFTSTNFPGEINPANDVPVTKKADGCQHQILYLFAFGEAGAGSVASNNGIKRIATIDHSTTSVFAGLLYQNYCTIVSGEGK